MSWHHAHPKVFRKRRAGIRLTRAEIREIRRGRKKLKREMKKNKVYSRHEFETTASTLGLYFDKGRFLALWLWLWHHGALWALLGAALLTMAALYGASLVTQMRGHFTINLTNEMVSQGFELCETPDFKNPTSRLYGIPVEDAPCISITDIPKDIDKIDGSHNGTNYFAHTFYVAKRGEGTADYSFNVEINSESLDSSSAIWVMLFEDGVPAFYAEANKQTGEAECLPAKDNNRYGYTEVPFADAGLSDAQYEIVRQTQIRSYYRIIPNFFKDDDTVVEKIKTEVEQDEVHKYTVVLWLEGDDPDCTNELIGGHIGMHMDFELLDD